MVANYSTPNGEAEIILDGDRAILIWQGMSLITNRQTLIDLSNWILGVTAYE